MTKPVEHGPSPALLRNMSARPRTPVALHVGDAEGPFVRFRWPASVPTARPSRRVEKRLEHAWERLGFRGAALLYAWRSPADSVLARLPNGAKPGLFAATDHDLCANVLRRLRSGPLLAHPSLATLGLGGSRRAVWTNDAQLVRLALETGVRRIKT